MLCKKLNKMGKSYISSLLRVGKRNTKLPLRKRSADKKSELY